MRRPWRATALVSIALALVIAYPSAATQHMRGDGIRALRQFTTGKRLLSQSPFHPDSNGPFGPDPPPASLSGPSPPQWPPFPAYGYKDPPPPPYPSTDVCPPCPVCSKPPPPIIPTAPPPSYHVDPPAPPPYYYGPYPPNYGPYPPTYGPYPPTNGPYPPTYQPNSPPSPLYPRDYDYDYDYDSFLTSLEAAANKLGLGFLWSFFKSASPALTGVLAELPVVANYAYKVISSRMSENLKDPSGAAANALYRILNKAALSLTSTDTGSMVAEFLLDNYKVDLVGAVLSNDLSQTIDVFKRSGVYGNNVEDIAADVSGSVGALAQRLVSEAVSPHGRLGPLGIAKDTAYMLSMVLDEVVTQAPILRDEAEMSFVLTDEEFYAIYRMKERMYDLSQSLAQLGEKLWNLDTKMRGPPGHDEPSRPPHDRPGPHREGFMDAIRGAADSLGLNFLATFFDHALPALRGILTELPTAADYMFNLFKAGRAGSFYGQERVSRAFDDILRFTLRKLASTTVGSLIANNYAIDLRALAEENDLEGFLARIRGSFLWSNYPGYSIVSVVSSIVYESVAPWGRLNPVTLAKELVDIAGTFTMAVSDNSEVFRFELSMEFQMSDPEYSAFRNLKEWFFDLDAALSDLSANLDRIAGEGTRSPPPLYWQSGSPTSPPSYGSGSSSSPPPSWWISDPSPPWWWTPPPPPARHDAAVDALKSVTDKLGLHFLVTFVQDAYPAISNILADGRIASSYLYKMLEAGLAPELADPSGEAAGCIYRILQHTFRKLSETDVGGLVITGAMADHEISLTALASASDFSQLLSTLKHASWLRDSTGPAPGQDAVGPADVVSTVLTSIWETFNETYSANGRLDPVTLAIDVTDVSLAMVEATVMEADTLRYLADVNFRMDDDEYWALWLMRTNLRSFLYSLRDLSYNLHQRE